MKRTRSVKNGGEGNIKTFSSPIILQISHHLFSIKTSADVFFPAITGRKCSRCVNMSHSRLCNLPEFKILPSQQQRKEYLSRKMVLVLQKIHIVHLLFCVFLIPLWNCTTKSWNHGRLTSLEFMCLFDTVKSMNTWEHLTLLFYHFMTRFLDFFLTYGRIRKKFRNWKILQKKSQFQRYSQELLLGFSWHDFLYRWGSLIQMKPQLCFVFPTQ